MAEKPTSLEIRIALLEQGNMQTLAYREERQKIDQAYLARLANIETQITLTKGAIGAIIFVGSCLTIGINLAFGYIGHTGHLPK